ncbi:MAG: carbon-nitrogen hydrolase family protein [Chloroflexi bacterium]|nr:carbon-nitrogen hydrolase family protein [Chloroflexota bacterium]MCY4248649.1 carbon-nitrogen hydrolase family protein [Chloroflexota bacterium]
MSPDITRVAIIQARPVYCDLPATIDKALSLIAQAARSGAQLAVLGETFFSGYPAWLDCALDYARWGHAPTKQLYARLVSNSLAIDSAAMRQLRDSAKTHGIALVFGMNERVTRGRGNRSLYNSLVMIDGDGALRNHHRKLRPTYTEQLVWAQGDGAGLRAANTTAGRVGGLICWEHWMPHARQALHLSGEDIHIALWPTVKPMHQIASRHYAFEGRCFVLAAGNIMTAADFPPELQLSPEQSGAADAFLLNGGSAIIAPDGEYLVEPVFDEETIITADLDLGMIAQEQMYLDVTGHYARDDIFDFAVNRRRLDP